MKVNAILLKPLDGHAPGTPRQFEKDDFERLRGMSAVREAGPDDDLVEEREDTDAMLLERLRHPVEGPRILADMKASFERHEMERGRLENDLSLSQRATSDAVAARDAAIVERDAATRERDAALQALAALEIKPDNAEAPTDTPTPEQAVIPRAGKAK